MLRPVLVALIGMAFLACGEKTASVSFNVEYSDDVVALLNNGQTTTVRFWYSWDALNGRAYVRPSGARPTTVIVNGRPVRNWAKAEQSGFSLSTVYNLPNFPVGQRGVEIGVELLQPAPGGQWKPVAFRCIAIDPPTEPWSLADMRSFSGTTITLLPGRTCGDCSFAQENVDTDTTCANAQ